MRSFFDHLLPQDCLLCGASATQAFCSPCLDTLPWLSAQRCPRCALPTPLGETCGHCLKHPPAFDSTYALLAYTYPLDALLRQYKYAHTLHVARACGELLARAIATEPRPDMLIPMPLHPERLKQRGFNQALEIAREISGYWDIPLNATACSRIKATSSQAGKTLLQRRRNVRGAFACHADLTGKRIALLDDVMTTGATLNALARSIRQAGAASVSCWVVARTLRD